MRAVWVDSGNDPHWESLAANGITWVYLPLSDPVADVRRRLLDVRARGLRGGVYAAWNWYPATGGAAFAEVVHSLVRLIAPDATSGWPKVQLDDETHDPARILGMLLRWRELRPTTDTSWTFEAMQGGWMTPGFVAEVINRKVRLVPQCYWWDMSATIDTLAVARDLTKRGFPDSLISPFYDAAKLPLSWDGFAFTAGRLPR